VSNDKVVVITGASAGIGAARAHLLAKRGMSLVLTARREDRLKAVAAECGEKAIPVVADARSRADVKRVVNTAIEHFGRIDVWVNNVGVGITRLPSQLTDEDIDDMIDINVKTAFYGMQEVLPHFKERGTGQVINVSSMLGRVAYVPFRSAYCGAKHFLNALTVTFRAEVQQTHPDIQFTLVSPGVVRTDFGLAAKYGGPDSRTLPDSQSAEDVAKVISNAIDSRVPDVYTRQGARDRIAGYYAAIGIDP